MRNIEMGESDESPACSASARSPSPSGAPLRIARPPNLSLPPSNFHLSAQKAPWAVRTLRTENAGRRVPASHLAERHDKARQPVVEGRTRARRPRRPWNHPLRWGHPRTRDEPARSCAVQCPMNSPTGTASPAYQCASDARCDSRPQSNTARVPVRFDWRAIVRIRHATRRTLKNTKNRGANRCSVNIGGSPARRPMPVGASTDSTEPPRNTPTITNPLTFREDFDTGRCLR